MIERDLSRLRFLCTRAQKGENLPSEDIDFIMKKQIELINIEENLSITLEILRERESQL